MHWVACWLQFSPFFCQRSSSDKEAGVLWIQGVANLHCQRAALDPKPENIRSLVNILPELGIVLIDINHSACRVQPSLHTFRQIWPGQCPFGSTRVEKKTLLIEVNVVWACGHVTSSWRHGQISLWVLNHLFWLRSWCSTGDLILKILGDAKIDSLLLSTNSSKDMSVDQVGQRFLSDGLSLLYVSLFF